MSAFALSEDPAGIRVEWSPLDSGTTRAFRQELLLSGLTRTRDWPTGTLVARYRNLFETLELVIAAVERVGASFTLDGELSSLRTRMTLETGLLKEIRSNPNTTSVPARLDEFASGRNLLGYQQTAVGRHLATRNAADFSVPGSGKTTVALAYWATARREEPGLGLWVIGPLSSFRPWEEEFEACFGRAPRALRIRGTQAQRARLLDRANDFDLVLSSYQGAWRDYERFAAALKRRPWLLVLDEAHYVKSPSGVLAETARNLGPLASRRMILTGTPMPRSPTDLWSQFTFLWPSEALLGNLVQYEARCARDPDALVTELKDELSPFFHRTCKSDLGLPERDLVYPVIPADTVPPSQRLLIRLIEQRTLQEEQFLSTRDRAFLRRWRRARVVRLLQAASNPLLLAEALTRDHIASVDDDEDARQEAPADEAPLNLDERTSDLAQAIRLFRDSGVRPAKLAHVEDRCRELVAQGHKVVIWTVFLGNVEALSERLDDLRPLAISGAVPLYDDPEDEEAEMSREHKVELFLKMPDRPVLIANMGACSEAISLHKACQHAIYLERSFNGAQFVQSLDRIHRQGMPPNTTAHIEIPSIPCAIERVLNRRLRVRQERMYELLNDPLGVVGFDDDAHRGLFDVEELEDIDALFEEVLAEIRRNNGPAG